MAGLSTAGSYRRAVAARGALGGTEIVQRPCLVCGAPALAAGALVASWESAVREGEGTTQGRQGLSNSEASLMSRSCLQILQVFQSVTTYFDRLMAGISRWRYATEAV